MSNNWVYKNRFGRPERQCKFTEKNGFVGAILMEGSKDLNREVVNTLGAMYKMCLDEWVPMFQSDNRYIRKFPGVLLEEDRQDRFESDLADSAKILLMGSIKSGLVGYLMVSSDHYILSMYVLPEYRKDGIAHSLMELYINRVDAPQLTVDPYILDTNAITFFKNLGFEETTSGLAIIPAVPTELNLIWRAKP